MVQVHQGFVITAGSLGTVAYLALIVQIGYAV